MTSRKGGYIIIDLTSTTLVDDLSKALGFGKPVLVYNANNEANFYTLTYASGTYTLIGVKDGFTIDSTGTITPVVPSGNKVYKHTLNIDSTNYQIVLDVLSSKSTTLTLDDLKTSAYLLCGVINIKGNTENYPSMFNIFDLEGYQLLYGFNYLDNDVAKYTSDMLAFTDITITGDTITEI